MIIGLTGCISSDKDDTKETITKASDEEKEVDQEVTEDGKDEEQVVTEDGKDEEQVVTDDEKDEEQVVTDDEKDEEQEVTDDEKDEDQEVTDDKSSVTIEEKVLIDKDGFKITALRLVEDSLTIFGPEIYFRIENNSEYNITVEMIEASINDLMVWPTLFSEVAAGEQVVDFTVIPDEDLINNGIDVISEIEFKFHILNIDNNEILLNSDVITINTSALNYVQKYDASGDVIYDKNGIKIVFKGLDTSDDIIGPQIFFYVENNTDQTISINTDNLLANGNITDGAFYCNIVPRKKVIESIAFFDFEGDGFEKITNIEFTFHIYDSATGETIEDSNTVSLDFE